MPTLAGKKTFPCMFSLLGYTFSILWRKKYKPDPSEVDIKVFILAEA